MVLEITVLVGLDEASESVIRNLYRASEVLLRRHRIKVVINPVNLWFDPLSSSINMLPVIFVNGVKVFCGYTPSVDEIVNFIVTRFTNRREAERSTLDEGDVIFGSLREEPLPSTMVVTAQ